MTKQKREKNERADRLIEELLEESGISAEAVLGEGGLLSRLKQRVIEKALAGELTHHLGYRAGEKPQGAENQRNGYSTKTVQGSDGEMELAIPRDRAGSFEPVLIGKGQKRFEGFDDRIIAMYARGMTVRDIRGFLLEQYRVDVGADFISTVTDAVVEEVVEWQNRPLERMYPVVFFDALRVKIRDEGTVKNKAVHLALGVRADGTRDILGIWVEQNEGAKFWLRVMNELSQRGVADILIAVVDGLKGFPEAITTVFPETAVQTCIVHLTRFSLAFCGWKERKAVADELKTIYRAETAEMAAQRLEEFDRSELGQKYPMIGQSWRRNWEQVIPFYSYPQGIRTMIYTTNAIESVNMQLRKVIKNRGQLMSLPLHPAGCLGSLSRSARLPSDESAVKLIWLALRNITAKWKQAPPKWGEASRQFAILYGERFTK